MAHIHTLPIQPRAPRDTPPSPGVLVAMAHVDLDEVVETVLLLRGSRRTQRLLDRFNRGVPTPHEDAPAA